jgi:hypothetical protein
MEVSMTRKAIPERVFPLRKGYVPSGPRGLESSIDLQKGPSISGGLDDSIHRGTSA